MKAEVVKVSPSSMNLSAIYRGGEILRKGGLVAFPTETVYGLGGDALDARASEKIYSAKGRPSDNPLIVHIADMEHLEAIVENIPPKAKVLAEKFWPGPLTMIFSKNEKVPYETTGGLDSVAVRMPNHPVALALIKACDGYVAAPSANRSGRPSPTTAAHVIEDLGASIDMIIDGGMVGIGIESTIVDFTEEIPTILRPGYISQEMLEDCIGPVNMDRALLSEDSNIRPKAPGMKYRHYAPRAPLTIVEGEESAVIEEINRLAAEANEAGYKVGIIGTDESVDRYTAGAVKSIGKREEEASIALHLYEVLREFDQMEVSAIYSEAFHTPRMGQAIMNRLLKAAGHSVINIIKEEKL